MEEFCRCLKILLMCHFVLDCLYNYKSAAQNPSQDANKVRFYLYPDKNNPNYRQELLINKPAILRASFFKPGSPTILYTHGLLDSTDNHHAQLLKNAYLASPYFTGNMILVDWGELAGPFSLLPDSNLQTTALSYSVPLVGNVWGNFLLFLNQEGFLLPNCTHLIGHSVGGHVCSVSGMTFQQKAGTKLGRITGLEPAPARIFGLTTKGLTADDACFVDTIHTTIQTIEFLGHANFFPFKAIDQPGCIEPIICSHYQSVKLYVYSLWMAFPACKCEPYSDPLNFVNCMQICPNRVNMGAYLPDTTRGNFVLFPIAPLADPLPYRPNLGWLTPPYYLPPFTG